MCKRRQSERPFRTKVSQSLAHGFPLLLCFRKFALCDCINCKDCGHHREQHASASHGAHKHVKRHILLLRGRRRCRGRRACEKGSYRLSKNSNIRKSNIDDLRRATNADSQRRAECSKGTSHTNPASNPRVHHECISRVPGYTPLEWLISHTTSTVVHILYELWGQSCPVQLT